MSATKAVAEGIPSSLRREVRLLSTILGRVLEEAGGPGLLSDVERLRTTTIAFRGVPSDQRRAAVVDVVEGFELEVLLGARRTLEAGRPALMVEVQAHQSELRALAHKLGYVVLDEHGAPNDLDATWAGNSFWLHPDRHGDVIEELRRRHG